MVGKLFHDATRNAMPYTLKQAAEATGKSKPTILRAIQSHKISATRDEVTQAWLIDPAELHRVYPLVSDDDTQQPENRLMTRDVIPNETANLRREVEIRDEKITALERERQREREEARDTIADLRRRLDREGEERRAAQAQLTALLTDQREKAAAPEPSPSPQRRSWWPWGRG